MARASQTTAPMLEVVGADLGHVYLSRAAANCIAPAGTPLLPALVALVAEHRAAAAGAEHTDHRRGHAVLRVVRTTSGLVVALRGADVGAA